MIGHKARWCYGALLISMMIQILCDSAKLPLAAGQRNYCLTGLESFAKIRPNSFFDDLIASSFFSGAYIRKCTD
jgi:hypothetical protein